MSDLKNMLYVDTVTWIPDRLLLKADKMTMANSLELRVPLLDPKTKNRGYFDYGKLRGSLIDAWKSKGEHPQEIFKLMVLELWHRSFVDSGNR